MINNAHQKLFGETVGVFSARIRFGDGELIVARARLIRSRHEVGKPECEYLIQCLDFYSKEDERLIVWVAASDLNP